MGMQDVVQNVVTQFNLQDNASGGLASLANNALGVSGAIQGVTQVINLMQAGLGMIQAPVMQAVQAHSRLEETVLGVAGALRAYEAVGQTTAQIATAVRAGGNQIELMSQAFQTAGDASRSIFRQMVSDAATLPGSAQDYVTAFSTALPAALSASRNASLRAITQISNDFTAVALVNQIDAGQAGRDMMLMMQGAAGMDVRTWRLLQPLMHRTARDTAALSAQQFNTLTGQQRFDAIRRALDAYMPLIHEFEGTWSTQMGTFQSLIDQFRLDMSGGIFEALKDGLKSVNTVLSSVLPLAGQLGGAFSLMLRNYVQPLSDRIATIGFDLKNIFRSIISSPAFLRFANIIEGTRGFVSRVLGTSESTNIMGGDKTPGQLRSEADSRFGLLALFTGPAGAGFIRFLTQGENFARMMNFLSQAASILWNIFVQIVDTLGGSTGVMANVFGNLIPLLQIGILGILNFINNHIPMVVMLLKGAFMVLVGVVAVVIGALGIIGLAVFLVSVPLIALAAIIGTVIYAFAQLANKIFEWLHVGTRITGPDLGRNVEAPPWLQEIRNNIGKMRAASNMESAAERNTGGRNQAQQRGAYNDFRYSRFDITQRFAEGFDPDRIAAVFASDLEGLAEQRLDSGFSPAFGSG